MGLIDEAIQALPAPPKAEIDVRAKRCRRLDEGATVTLSRSPRSMLATRRRETRVIRDIRLAPLEPGPKGAELPTEPKPVHDAMVDEAASPRLT